MLLLKQAQLQIIFQRADFSFCPDLLVVFLDPKPLHSHRDLDQMWTTAARQAGNMQVSYFHGALLHVIDTHVSVVCHHIACSMQAVKMLQ